MSRIFATSGLPCAFLAASAKARGHAVGVSTAVAKISPVVALPQSSTRGRGLSSLRNHEDSKRKVLAAAAMDVAPEAIGKASPRVRDGLVCPICHSPLQETGKSSSSSPLPQHPECQGCGRRYTGKGPILDLTIASSSEEFQEKQHVGTSLFESPAVSFLYERGWRQSFAWAKFPGADKEFEMATGMLSPAAGELLLDVSCGSGLFSRRFARSGAYAAVVASDFSLAMLEQCADFTQREDAARDGRPTPLALVRADVSRLPFATGSLGGVHAGAALHCWPSPSNALAEICRVLKPGGVFVASTFRLPPLQLSDEIARRARRVIQAATSPLPIRLWQDAELADLAAACGLVDFAAVTDQNFIMFSARKRPAA